MKLREIGIIEKLRRQYIPAMKKKSRIKHINNLVIELKDVYPIFFLLVLGIIASMVIITSEIIHISRKKWRNRHLKVNHITLRGCWTDFVSDWNSAISKSHGELLFLAAIWPLHMLNPQGSTMQQHVWYGGLACLLYHWYCYGKFR